MTLSKEELKALRECAEGASEGPWRAIRDGNQYIVPPGADFGRLVGASRVEGLIRPWNPKSIRPASELEGVARFKDEDADYIAAFNPATALRLLDELELHKERFRILEENHNALLGALARAKAKLNNETVQ